MNINLELTDRGLEVHVTTKFDPKFEERGRVTSTLLREKLREHGITTLTSIKNTMLNFHNQSDTWIFEAEQATLKQVRDSSLECKNSRSKVEEISSSVPEEASQEEKSTTLTPEKALQEEKISVPSKRRTRKKSSHEV